MYVPDNLNWNSSSIFFRNYYKNDSEKPWREWKALYFNDYSNKLLDNNGFIIFNNGLIIQWENVDMPQEYYLNNKLNNTLINKYYILHPVNYPMSFTSKIFFTFAYDVDITVSEFNDIDKDYYANGMSGGFPISRNFGRMNTTSTAYFIWELEIDYTIGSYKVFSIGM